MVFCGEGGIGLVLAPDLSGNDTEVVGFWDEGTTTCPGLVSALGFVKKALSFICDCLELAPLGKVDIMSKKSFP